MKAHVKRLAAFLLAVCLTLGCFALAEEVVESVPVDRAVEEVPWDLADGFEVWSEEAGVLAAEDEAAAAQPAAEIPASTPEPDPAAEPAAPVEPEATATPEPGPEYFSGPLQVHTITLKKATTKKNVTLGLSYQVQVNGETIRRCRTSDKKIASLSKAGVLTLRKAGKATITVTAESGSSYKLKLTVKDAPTPTTLKTVFTTRHCRLKWTGAKHATRYLVQVSGDGKKWKDFKSTAKTWLDVTGAVTGQVFFRVRAVLGDHFGGTSEVLSVLSAVTDAKVIMEESYRYGPTDHLNVTWTATPGATKYEVWRASLPSKKYKRIGTTKKTWFADTLAPTKLYSYKIRPVWNGLDNLPFCAPVNLWSGLEKNVLPPSDLTSSTGIILVVNKKAQVVTAYIEDAKGKYTLPLRHMICSTGMDYDRTRNGIYTINSHAGEWYTYSSGVVIRWPSVYRSGYYFHSPWYSRDHSTTLAYTVRRLGSRASAGCVRLKSNDAEWVYKYCPNGTTVYICDGGKRDDLKEAIKPRTVEVRGF